MDTARQIVRWALPGWMAVLFWTGFIAVNTLIHGQVQPIYIAVLKKMSDLVILLGAAAIPLGFVTYQVYYWMYWYVPIPSVARRKLIDPVDRGKQILSGVKDQIDFKEIFDTPLNDTPATAFKKWGPIHYKSIEVMQKYRQNWHLSESAWYLALANDRYKNTADLLEKRNQFLGDIYHSLGACYHALAFAYVVYILAFGYISFVELSSGQEFPLSAIILRLGSLAANSAICFLAYSIFRGGRIASFDALLALKHDVITNVMLDRPTMKENGSMKNGDSDSRQVSEGS